MKKIMAIFAHPDDEGMVSGTLARYIHHDGEVMLVCATRGEVGEISDPALATPETLGQVRQQELEEACRILGVQHLEFLDYRDSGMAGTAENNDTRALIQSDMDEFSAKIVALIRRFQPDAVITFEPFGWYGHPDHIYVSQGVTAAFPLAGDAKSFADAGPPWLPQGLYYSVFPISQILAFAQKAIEAGYIEEGAFGDDFPVEQQLQTEAQVTHSISVSEYIDIGFASMRAHQTQFGEDNYFRKIPEEILRTVFSHELFIQVSPTPSPALTENSATDLFSS